jgi:hypothetical protein
MEYQQQRRESMRMKIVIAGIVLWAAPLMAEMYSWVDDKGTYNFTEDYSSIPKKYRKHVKAGSDIGNPEPARNEAGKRGRTVDAAKKTANVKNPVAWTKEFSDPYGFVKVTGREGSWKEEAKIERMLNEVSGAAMELQRLDDAIKNSPAGTDEHQKLQAERKVANDKYTQMRRQYIDAARRAGFEVEVR